MEIVCKIRISVVTCIGTLATMICKLRQAWKGATVAVILGAEEWLVWVAVPISYEDKRL